MRKWLFSLYNSQLLFHMHEGIHLHLLEKRVYFNFLARTASFNLLVTSESSIAQGWNTQPNQLLTTHDCRANQFDWLGIPSSLLGTIIAMQQHTKAFM